jgi:predicted peptidase
MKFIRLFLLTCLAFPLTTACQATAKTAVTSTRVLPQLLTKSSAASIAGTPLFFQVSLPPAAAAPAAGWPLLLFLHGAGERGRDVSLIGVHGPLSLVDTIDELRSCVIVAPQCPTDAWWEHDALKTILDETRAAYPIDEKRIYVTGLSMGGYGTWDMLSRYPDLFAAAVPICGGGDLTRLWEVPTQGFELGNLLLAKDVPIRAFHGEVDTVVPVEESRLLVDTLQAAGSSATLTTYPGVGHNSWAQTYADPELYKWLFAQVKR